MQKSIPNPSTNIQTWKISKTSLYNRGENHVALKQVEA